MIPIELLEDYFIDQEDGLCSPESISHTLYPWTRNTGYEIGPTQDPLDYPSKAEGGDYKADCIGYENIAEAGATNLEKLCREQARAFNWREHGAAQEAL